MTDSHVQFRPLIDALIRRSGRAMVGQFGAANSNFSDWLSATYMQSAGRPGGLLADPVLEPTFGWAPAPCTMSDLAADGLLSRDLVAAMDKPAKDLRDEYRFRADWSPYAHQLAAWKHLLAPQPQSVLVTSGTGSGKTECFMVPVLQALAQERAEAGRLSGVRALMLYPLNALINSQRDRLRAWTAPFGGDIRFCLYNGETPDSQPSAATRSAPEEQRTRKALRADPAPILVTNATMLEYMLVRTEDAPILAASKGKLRWIVLDEAHTYIGSQAAELTLLIRRVLHRFGVDPADVRFVATSATIGGKGSTEALRDFLQQVSGAPREHVHVVTGDRQVPALGTVEAAADLDLDALEALEAEDRYRRLAATAVARTIRAKAIEGDGCLQVGDVQALMGEGWSHDDAVRLLDLCTSARIGDDVFLPLRLHLFHRTQGGLWACANSGCSGREQQGLTEGWPFGTVLDHKTSQCPICEHPVYEIARCTGCGEEHLLATFTHDFDLDVSRLLPQVSKTPVDEFALDQDVDESDDIQGEDETAAPKGGVVEEARCLIGRQMAESEGYNLGLDGQLMEAGAGPRIHLSCAVDGKNECHGCHETGGDDRFWPMLLGAPFALSTVVPTVLEHTPPKGDGLNLPFQGRRVLSFSDSRQGSARLAVRLQQEAERNCVRSVLVHNLLREAGGHERDDQAQKLKAEIGGLEEAAAQMSTLPAPIVSMLQAKRAEMAELEVGAAGAVSQDWADAASELGRGEDFARMYKRFTEQVDFSMTSQDFAQYCLYREFFRRPRRMNSLETMGLVRLVYPKIRARALNQVPAAWGPSGLGGTDAEWVDYVELVVDFFIRALSAVLMDRDQMRWLGVREQVRYMLGPADDSKPGKNQVRWPRPRAKGRPARMVRYLQLVFDLDLADPMQRDQVADVMAATWRVLQPDMVPSAEGFQFRLDQVAALAPMANAYICPYSHRVLGTTLRGISPYVPWGDAVVPQPCVSIRLPEAPHAYWRNADGYRWSPEEVADWLESDPGVQAARAARVWSSLNDRVVAESAFFSVGEHSAQLSGQRLRQLEERFKAGEMNLLSCSTTMEMGVDVGGLSAVMMANVPPHPANYRQRAGRAGRRGEGASFSVTLCRATPHGEATFRNPKWSFTTDIRPPRVALDSERLVQRHVNAMALGHFLLEHDVRRLKAGWFFERGDLDASPSAALIAWSFGPALEDANLVSGLERLTRGSPVAGREPARLMAAVADTLDSVSREWLAEIATMEKEANAFVEEGGGEKSAGLKAVLRQQQRAREEYLLSELVRRGFLPGYGFPTDVVSFVTTTVGDLKRQEREGREDAYGQRQGYPSRHAAVAIRDYAPGAEVVMDGRVYESSGVTLNWHVPAGTTDAPEIQAFRQAWRCGGCGASGTSPSLPLECHVCGAESEHLRGFTYLQPAGFAVDLTSRPHNDVSKPHYIIPEVPWVSCPTDDWVALPQPEVGRFRYTERGHLFHHNGGRAKQGYAICLRCGRAADEAAVPKDDRPMIGHKRLRGGKDASGSNYCDGNDSEWAIKRHVHLGSSQTTDVFELQLNKPVDRVAAFSLAVALRRALCGYLGVEAREVGVGSSATVLPSGEETASVFLFDSASSATGYTQCLTEELAQLVTTAGGLLDCPEECDSACSACLLDADSQYQVDSLNRFKALELFDDGLVEAMELPENRRYFGQASRSSTKSLTEAVQRAASDADTQAVQLWLGGQGEDWAPEEWPHYQDMLGWCARGIDLYLHIDPASWGQLPEAVKHALASRVEALDGRLRVMTGKAPATPQGDGRMLARVLYSQASREYAVDPSVAMEGHARWGTGNDSGLVVWRSGDDAAPLAISEVVALQDMRPEPKGTLARLDILRDIDGPLDGFAGRFWHAVLKAAPELEQTLVSGEALSQVVYSDKYLRSPWNMVLLRDLICALTGYEGAVAGSTELQVFTLPCKSSGPAGGGRRTPSRAVHDFPDGAEKARREFFERIIDRAPAKQGWPGRLKFTTSAQCPHWRAMDLVWASGARWSLQLDHGFGHWEPRPDVPFPFEGGVKEQARALDDRRTQVVVTAKGRFATRVYVGKFGGSR